MNKWKQYEGITKASKLVGGPNKLVAIIAFVGAIGGVAISKMFKFITNKKSIKLEKTYEIKTSGNVNDNVIMEIGTRFSIIVEDEDAVIIKTESNDEPIIAKREMLCKISNYK